MKALTHADSANTCKISPPLITSAPSAKRFLAKLNRTRGPYYRRNLNFKAVTRRGESRRILRSCRGC
jgi:hypothetical protein